MDNGSKKGRKGYVKIIILLLLFILFTFCWKSEKNENLNDLTPLQAVDTYPSLEAFTYALEADVENSCPVLHYGTLYYLEEDQGLHLESVKVGESYFNCQYENDILLITDRAEDGNAVLEHLLVNNSDLFIKETTGALEYYVIQGDDVTYYFWIQDGDLLQLNLPVDSDVTWPDVLSSLESVNLDAN